jgi:hypothetical protein
MEDDVLSVGTNTMSTVKKRVIMYSQNFGIMDKDLKSQSAKNATKISILCIPWAMGNMSGPYSNALANGTNFVRSKEKRCLSYTLSWRVIPAN